MKIFAFRMFVLISFVCISINSIGQSNNKLLDSLIYSIEKYNSLYYEKIYAHTNKEVYLVGDNIWFKAYVTGIQNKFSDSKTIYAQLYDSTATLVSIQRYPIKNGLSSGVFLIDEEINDGVYDLVFSTQKSKVSKGHFLKKIKIIDNNSNMFEGMEASFDSKLKSINSKQLITYQDKNQSVFINAKAQAETYLLIMINGELIWASSKDQHIVEISTKEYTTGSGSAILFDQKGNILDQVLFRITNAESSLNLVQIKDSVQKDISTFKIELTNNGEPVSGNLSVSAYMKESNYSGFETRNSVDYISHSSISYYDLKEVNLNKIEEEPFIIYGEVLTNKSKAPKIKAWALNLKRADLIPITEMHGRDFWLEVESKYKGDKYVISAKKRSGYSQEIHLKDSIQFKVSKEQLLELRSDFESDYTKSIDEIDTVNYKASIKLEGVTIKDSRILPETLDQKLNVLKGFIDMEFSGEASRVSGRAGLPEYVYLRRNTIERKGDGGTPVFPMIFVVDGGKHVTARMSELEHYRGRIKSVEIDRGIRFSPGGVMFITTTDSDEVYNEYINDSYAAVADFYGSDITFFQNPTFESCIFWESDLEVSTSGVNFEFETPITLGTLVIKIEGIDQHQNFISLLKEVPFEELIN